MKTNGQLISGGDVQAAERAALFWPQPKKWIGSSAAALGGLDTLLFAGDIGENAPLVRTRICHALGLGIASEKAIHAKRRNTSLGWICFRRAVPPP